MKDYHELPSDLSDETKDYTRAIASFIEELEAVLWYQQRADACKDIHLKKILIHNRDEEMEHACMTQEWLRRNMDDWDEQMRTYLFTEKEITEIEEDEEDEKNKENRGVKENKDLGIGKL
ncbi:MAG: encapsulin-associated ferritin-like protein [bacterium]